MSSRLSGYAHYAHHCTRAPQQHGQRVSNLHRYDFSPPSSSEHSEDLVGGWGTMTHIEPSAADLIQKGASLELHLHSLLGFLCGPRGTAARRASASHANAMRGSSKVPCTQNSILRGWAYPTLLRTGWQHTTHPSHGLTCLAARELVDLSPNIIKKVEISEVIDQRAQPPRDPSDPLSGTSALLLCSFLWGK